MHHLGIVGLFNFKLVYFLRQTSYIIPSYIHPDVDLSLVTCIN